MTTPMPPDQMSDIGLSYEQLVRVNKMFESAYKAGIEAGRREENEACQQAIKDHSGLTDDEKRIVIAAIRARVK
jgi:hypothetical protein